MKQIDISVVVPCFNEGRTIFSNLKTIHHYLDRHFDVYEIITVDDGSKDSTLGELKRFQSKHPVRIIEKPRNEGKGSAVRTGVAAAKFKTVMFLDADLGIPIDELEKFVKEIENGHDMAIASRFVPGLKVRRPVPWHRRIMERGFRLLRVLIINDRKIKDTQCGFKIFKQESAKKIFPKLTLNRFAFDAELVFVALKNNCKIKELPISLQNPPNSHVRILRDPLNMFFDLIKIKINDLRGKYDSDQ